MGLPMQWFHATTGAYSGYDVYISTTGATTYFSLDHTAAGATYWQLTNAGAWSYYDGSAWYSTAGFGVEPADVWFHGYAGIEAGWDTYNSTVYDCSYYTHDYMLYWQQMNVGGAWNYYNGTAWVSTDALGNAPYDGGYGPPNEWFHATTGAYSGYDVYITYHGGNDVLLA